MSNLQYIGARYVPKFYKNSLDPTSCEWESGVGYEPLTVVIYNDDSYTSKKVVPSNVGAPDTAPEYWALTGNFNASLVGLQNAVADHEQRIDDLESFEAEAKEQLFHIESFRSYKKGHSYPHSTLQGGCYNTLTDEIICYLDGDLTKLKADGTRITATDIGFSSHYNSITFDSKHNKLLISGGGTAPDHTYGFAVVDYSSLNLIEVRTIAEITDYIHVIAYDEVHNVIYIVTTSGDGFIVDADTYEVLNTFTPAWYPSDIPAANVLQQGGFCYMGQFYQIVGARGESNRLYCYDIHGHLLYVSAYNITDDREIQFIDSTSQGIVVGYLDKYGANSMLILDYESASAESELKAVYYVDETATDNGLGSQQYPFNDAAFMAHDCIGMTGAIIEILSDCSKSPIILRGMRDISWRGHNHVMSNAEYGNYGVYFQGCDGYIAGFNAATHVRVMASKINFDNAKFTISGTSAALNVANSGEAHLQNCTFTNCSLCVVGTWGAKITAQNPTGSGNTRFAVLQNAAQMILNYASQPAPSDVYFNNPGLAIINGTPQYT